MEIKEYEISAFWDNDASVWVVESDDIAGLITEADTIDALNKKLQVLIPELLHANHAVFSEPTHYWLKTNCHEIISV